MADCFLAAYSAAKNKNPEWLRQEDCFISVYPDTRNNQQLKWTRVVLEANRRRFFRPDVAEKWKLGCFGCQGLKGRWDRFTEEKFVKCC